MEPPHMRLSKKQILSRTIDAEAKYKKGKNALKTGVLAFKWNKDHLGASMYFEEAGKIYKEIGNDIMAKECYLKCGESNKALDLVGSAAESYVSAALLEQDPDKQTQMLREAQMLYLRDGKGSRGIQAVYNLAKDQMEEYEDSDPKDEYKLERIINLYKSVYDQLFDDQEYLLMNSDMVYDYPTALMKCDRVHETIAARERYIDYQIEIKEVDHTVNRAYLEIVCLHMIANEHFKIPDVLERFMMNVRNAHSSDEYRIADSIGKSIQEENWTAIQQIMKKPIFNHLIPEIVKKTKMYLIDKVNNAVPKESNLFPQNDDPIENPQQQEEEPDFT